MTKKPHTCPTCEGHKIRAGEPCPTCEGKGVVWEPEGPQEGREAPETDVLDLTYRT